MIQRVAILDSETTGKSPEEGRCIEVACCIYDVPRATPVRSFASLLQGPAENAAEPVNGIPPAILPDAPEAARVWKVLSYAVEGCSALVAHKADFDMQFIPQDVQHGLPWICTFNDLAWPKAFKRGMGLVAIAHAHGLGMLVGQAALAIEHWLGVKPPRAALASAAEAALLARRQG